MNLKSKLSLIFRTGGSITDDNEAAAVKNMKIGGIGTCL
jgi:hypothetical protein